MVYSINLRHIIIFVFYGFSFNNVLTSFYIYTRDIMYYIIP